MINNDKSVKYNEHLLSDKGYLEVEKIGQGGHGTVYKCKNKRNQLIAVKLLDVEDYDDINKGLHEAFHLNGLDHKNIVKVYDVYLINNTKLAIEMEYLEYGSLEKLLTKDKIFLSEKLMKQLLQKACNALKYLKDKNIVHRDIKLENLLIKKLDNEEIDIVLIDFGFIKNLKYTPSVYRIGTVRYIAPEILVSNDDISVKPYSAKSDIYSLAVTLFKLMSNDNVIDIAQSYHFFKDDKKVKEELRKKIKENETVKYSDEFINLILKMLERNVNDRYDVEDVLFEIKNLNQKEQYLLKQNKLKKKKEKLIGFSNKFNYVSQFGSYGKENDQFNDILDILIDSTCNEQLYIVDSKNCRISIFNLNGEYLNQFKLAFEPSCITLDNVTDTLLIGDYNNSIIYRYSKSGKLIDQYGTTGNEKNWYISGIVMDPLSTTGNFYVSNYTENKIQLFSRDGKLLNEFKENIQKPNDIIFNDKNQFIISDGQDKCLKLFNKQGQLIKRFGDYHFKNPRGLLFDSVKKQYIICDELNDNLVVLNEKGGLVACPFGKNGKGQEEFQVPVNLALNYKTGMLYVVDWGNVCIKLFK